MSGAVIPSSRAESFRLSDYRDSEIKALQTLYPKARERDIFIVSGEAFTPLRNATFLPLSEIAEDPEAHVSAIVSEVYKQYGDNTSLQIFIVPKNGLQDAPYEAGTYFNVSASPDSILLFSQTGQTQQDHIPLRRYAATELVETLRSLRIAPPSREDAITGTPQNLLAKQL